MTAVTLTTTGATFGTTGAKFGSGFQASGYSVASSTGMTVPYTIECWHKAPTDPNALLVLWGSSSGGGFFGSNSGGGGYYLQVTGGGDFTGTGLFTYDGAWHHYAVVVTASQIQIFKDGALFRTVATTGTPTPFADLGIGNMSGAPSYQFPGSVDEFAIWNGAKYTGAFSPPTSAYTGSEANLLHLWHFDGDGTDSVGATAVTPTPPTIAPNDPGLTYSPYNWLVTSTSAKTINAGAYFNCRFTGNSCALLFDMTNAATPYSQVYYRIDGGQWIKATVAASVACTMPADTTGWNKHRLDVIVKSTSEFLTRWTAPQPASVVFTGLTLDSGATVSAIAKASKNVLIYGDSITEGFKGAKNLGGGQNDPDGSDGLLTYSYSLRDLLGVEIGVVGFGGSGISNGGQGGVPGLTTSYNLLWSGQPRTFSPVPDLVVINEGQNEAATASATYQTAYTAMLNTLLSLLPTAKIAAMRPFSGVQAAAIQAAVAGCNDTTRTYYVDTSGIVFDGTQSFDGVHPWGVEAVTNLGPMTANLLRPILYPTGQEMVALLRSNVGVQHRLRWNAGGLFAINPSTGEIDRAGTLVSGQPYDVVAEQLDTTAGRATTFVKTITPGPAQ
jgi:lysophospholipase L1-like esterase